jgi:UDP-N-acetylmuramoylalanine--D-glutamate ligase
LLDDGKDYDLWVLELSSFQLELTFSLKPLAATILNISPDHLDRHHSLDDYIKAKQRIYNNSQFILFNREDKHTFPEQFRHLRGNIGEDLRIIPPHPTLSPKGERRSFIMHHLKQRERSEGSPNVQEMPLDAHIVSYSLTRPDAGNWGIIEQKGHCYLAYGNECLLAVDNLRIKGKHNWQNALAACALASAAGIELKHQLSVLQTFTGLPHRCQWVRTLEEVEWINDSKGTNIGAAISAIFGIGSSMQGKIILIAGGIGKGADFTELRNSIAEYVRAVILIGEDANKIEQALKNTVPLIRASSLEKAVDLARLEAIPGDTVLLSPACASFDMFHDFNHRGEVFTQLVNQL